MSQNRVVWDGMTDFKAMLRKMPSELRDEGSEIVDDATHRTETNLVQAYPRGDSGDLRGGVRATVARTEFGAVGQVKSTSPHAHLWEFGTAVRSTRQGWNRGRSPSHVTEGLIPIAQRNRRQMYQQLIGLVQRAGFDVTGVP